MNSIIRTLALTRRGIRNYLFKKPFCVSFEITYSCNAKCQHCHLGGPVKEKRAGPREYAEICNRLNPVVAQISGGEPLLRHDVEQIIREIKNPNGTPIVVLTTNAALLTAEKYLQLREAGVDEFSVSFDYPDERHDEFRGIPGLFNKIKSLLEKVQSIDNNGITLSCVVQSKNYRELIKIAEFALSYNVTINFSTYTWLRTDKKEFMVPRNELPILEEVIKKLIKFKKKYKNIYTSDYIFKNMVRYFENGSLPNCRAGERFLVINPDGNFSPCGLIIKQYHSQEEIKKDFLKTNSCQYCFTSIRGNSEKPAKYLIMDSLISIRSYKRAAISS